MCAASRQSSTLLVLGIGKIGEDNEFLSFINVKQEWESPPSILVTRNPNLSQIGVSKKTKKPIKLKKLEKQ